MLELNLQSDHVVTIERAEELVAMSARECGIEQHQAVIFEFALRSIECMEIGRGRTVLRLHDLHAFLTNIQKAIRSGDHSFLWQPRGLRVKRVVDVIEFVESTEFLAQKGYVRPRIMEELVSFFNKPYIEGVLTGGIGIGKNYFADLAFAYMIYLLSVLENPQIEYDLAPGSSIVFIVQSLTERLAKKVVFEQFSERLRLSPYFTKHFPFNPEIKSELRFPNNIYVLPVGGNDTAAIGMNVFGGIIDELNFMQRTVDSRYKRTDEEMFDQAERNYMSLRRRMKSRFLQKGKIPGRLLLVSSVNHPEDFTDRKIQEAKTDPSIFILKLALWESLPPDKMSSETFLVEVGSDIKQSRIIASREDAIDTDDVIEIPMDFYEDFRRDIDMALREIGGTAISASHPFIPHRELIKQAQDNFAASNGGRQLFTIEECVISQIVGDVHDPNWSNLVNHDYISENILDPSVVFAAHIDVGVTQDALGIAIVRIIGSKLMPAARFWDERSNNFVEVRDMQMPFYQVDGLLRVVPPPVGEIDLELARDLIIYLRGLLNVKWGTMDSYQSTMMIQSFRKMRIKSGVLSVDTSLAPYAELKQAIKDARILFPPHATAARELREIEKNKKGKIDHPQGGSKDVSDAMAGAVYILQRKEAIYGRPVGRVSRERVHQDMSADHQVRKIKTGV